MKLRLKPAPALFTRRFEAQLHWQPVVQVQLHSTGDASPLAALLLVQILPSILTRRALPAGRLARLGATPDLHHGLLDATGPGHGANYLAGGGSRICRATTIDPLADLRDKRKGA